MIGADDRGPDVAEDGVGCLVFLGVHAGLAAVGDLTEADRARTRGDLKALQAIGDEGQQKHPVPGLKGTHGCLGERPRRPTRRISLAGLAGLHRGHECSVALRAPAGLVAAAFSLGVGVADLHSAGELALGLCPPQPLQDLVLVQPGAAVAHSRVHRSAGTRSLTARAGDRSSFAEFIGYAPPKIASRLTGLNRIRFIGMVHHTGGCSHPHPSMAHW